ncbi:hypothetical protein TVAG_435390 [Trichomonas vaginalis G3]|uniref:Phosphoprotein phosphatase n=1 Tax=Trichomonas vaginalis (strain ATCC PRA-98 / G3) TaxID=412133 RepID=A2FRI5_TRIV3|nr:protein phosphatase regulator protein [Trichomonas vaginalis G3]EAX92487.1 hypothetical protein TVAG_435390 [Trichomonas vaginalis G3]KAI5515335.1 protein phosphatase regulator protein [Trichomonas vaginalis G3]|eukprot:XP_001305417.1 hypothetical protein [Trichomonas vaginalis G3]
MLYRTAKGPQFSQSKSALQIRGSLNTSSIRNSSMRIFPQLKSPTKSPKQSLKPLVESKYELDDVDFSEINIDIAPPLTQNANLDLIDMNNLIESVQEPFEYKLYCHAPESTGVTSEKTFLISKLYEQVLKNPLISTSDDVLTKIFAIADQNIRYKLSSVNEFLFISDYPVYFMLTGIEYIRIWYAIIETYLQKFSFTFNENYWKYLIERFKSPVKDEQNLARDTLLLFFKKFQDQRDFIIDEINHIFKSYKEKVLQHFVVQPALQFLVTILSQLNQIPSIFFAQSRVIVFPLFITPRVEEFFDVLSKYSDLFTKKDSTTTLFYIRYLLKHWPITDSHKHIIFLNELHVILFSLNPTFFPTICVPVCSKLFLSVQSSNAKVCTTAFSILGDEGFLSMLIKTVGFIPTDLERSISTASSSWSEEVKKAAQSAHDILLTIKSKAEQPQQSDFVQKWKKVARFANKNYHNEFSDFDNVMSHYSFDFSL